MRNSNLIIIIYDMPAKFLVKDFSWLEILQYSDSFIVLVDQKMFSWIIKVIMIEINKEQHDFYFLIQYNPLYIILGAHSQQCNRISL